jgi:hypothetical protein
MSKNFYGTTVVNYANVTKGVKKDKKTEKTVQMFGELSRKTSQTTSITPDVDNILTKMPGYQVPQNGGDLPISVPDTEIRVRNRCAHRVRTTLQGAEDIRVP